MQGFVSFRPGLRPSQIIKLGLIFEPSLKPHCGE
jgi:hypothetical protein